ncbi:MAG: hypothetical protein LBC95_01285 [Candidatus Nomurabacteria bacterium]|jgi:hypothetical protein|nr:hypothetical protein [Candidatus Nomurabacteria bacterium]
MPEQRIENRLFIDGEMHSEIWEYIAVRYIPGTDYIGVSRCGLACSKEEIEHDAQLLVNLSGKDSMLLRTVKIESTHYVFDGKSFEELMLPTVLRRLDERIECEKKELEALQNKRGKIAFFQQMASP